MVEQGKGNEMTDQCWLDRLQDELREHGESWADVEVTTFCAVIPASGASVVEPHGVISTRSSAAKNSCKCIERLQRRFNATKECGENFIAWTKRHVIVSQEYGGHDYLLVVPRHPYVDTDCATCKELRESADRMNAEILAKQDSLPALSEWSGAKGKGKVK